MSDVLSNLPVSSFSKFLFDFQSEYLEECALLFEPVLEDKKLDFEAILQEKTSHLSDKERMNILNYTDTFSDEENDILKVESFFQITRTAFFIKLYSIFEDSLDHFCKECQKFRNELLAVSDISGKGIFRARKYLAKVIKLDFNPIQKVWQNITNYNKIRNAFAHTGGKIQDKKESKEMKKICDSINGTRYDIAHNQIILEKDFLTTVRNDFRILFDHLENQLSQNKNV